MAPSPEQHNEPKAPDKNDNTNKSSNKNPSSDSHKHEAKHKNIAKSTSTDAQEKKVSALDDGQLRELLEEAVSYKCPKDRHGKSPLFMELLQRAEADERNQRATNASGSQVVRHYNTAYSHKNRNKQSKEASAAERNSHGGSLQNLYQVNDHTTNRKTRKKSSSVSARQREGGSLPSCNIVPLDKITFEKPSAAAKMETSHVHAAHALSTIKPEYTTIDLSNAEPEETQCLIENDSLNAQYHDRDVEMKVFNNEDTSGTGGSGGIITNTDADGIQNSTYTSSASLEITDSRKSNSDDSTALYPSSTEQRKVINGLETTPLELASNYSSVKSVIGSQVDNTITASTRTRSTTATKEVNSGQTYNNFLSFPHRYLMSERRFDGLKDINDKKTFDENGNTVSTFNSTLSSTSETRKTKKSKPKTDRNVTISKPESFKGFCGDKDVDSLVKFIEATNTNDKPHNKNNKHVVNNVNAKTHKNVANFNKEESERSGKKRSTERRSKEKSEKLKKSNSLEEISKTKLEDLTTENNNGNNSGVSLRRSTKKQATFDDVVFTDQKGDRRSWGTEEGQQYYCNDNNNATDNEKHKRKENKIEKSTVKPDVINTNPPDIMSMENLGPVETSDFHVVTKKKKSKKRRSTSGGRGNLFAEENRNNTYYQRDNLSKFPAHDHCDNDMSSYMNTFKNNSPDHRRKSTCSMPPSDKSNDSSDLDSVHSLPVESTSTKMCLQQVSTSSGGTPQASYADIAKMANVHTASTYATTQYGVDIKNAEKWPSVNNGKTPPLNKTPQPPVMSVKNYNYPDLIIDNCNTENCYLDKIFTTVSELEAKHLSEAKHNFKLKNSKTTTDMVTSPPNSRILQDQYPALEKTIPTKVDVKNKKTANSEKTISNNKTKLKNNNNSNNNNNNSNSEVPTTATKGCDIDKKLSNTTTANASHEYQELLPNSKQQNLNTNNKSATSSHQRKTRKHQSSSQGTTANSTSTSTTNTTRPAVIILNDTENNSSGITFGFDINEKLLSGETSSPETVSSPILNGDCNDDDDVLVPTSAVYNKCPASPTATIEPDTVSSASCNSIVTVVEQTQVCAVEDFTARFIAPPKIEEAINYNHDKIVNFVGLAWEDIKNQQNDGKVQYYSGQ